MYGANHLRIFAVGIVAFIFAAASSVHAQSNWQQQQQQQQRQMDMQRQQDIQRQQQMQAQEQQRRQMQDQQRQQMQDQQRQQMRQQMQDQQRQQMQTQQRQQMQDQQRQQMQSQQRQQLQNQQQSQQRQTLQQQQQAQQKQTQQQQQQTAQQQRQQMQQQGKLGATAGGISTNISRLNRPLTSGEIQRGFTGRVTPDGRALIKHQGRIFTVPASRVSGATQQFRAKAAATSLATSASLKASAAQRVARLSASSGGRPPTGSNDNAANDNLRPVFRSKAHDDQYQRAVDLAKSSPSDVLMLGRYPDYLRAAFFGKSDSFFLKADQWRRAEANYIRGNPKATKTDIENHMFEEYNKKYIDQHITKGGKIILASPYTDMKGDPAISTYSQKEILYLESRGFVLSADGMEMTKQ